RVPKIDNTIEELGWKPGINMEAALRRIFEAYRGKVVEARTLVDSAN
ncbi:bifunctional UDP-4-keto-pentose/UDP-xylose synthase, partial [Cupriavidus necator]